MQKDSTNGSLLEVGLNRAKHGLRRGLRRLDALLAPQPPRPKPTPSNGKAPQKSIAESYGIASCNWDGYVDRPASKLPMLGNDALEKLVRDYDFETVLDLGAGSGVHTQMFRKHGRKVSALDISASPNFKPDFVGDFMKLKFDEPFDCIWCCHVLEHVPNVRTFLQKIQRDLREGGILAITVPPAKHEIVGGHITLWNAGLLLYNLVLTGFDCSEAAVKTYGYNVSVIVPKRTIAEPLGTKPFKDLQPYFPIAAPPGFDGRIRSVNW